jgi:hypothetical protein
MWARLDDFHLRPLLQRVRDQHGFRWRMLQ